MRESFENIKVGDVVIVHAGPYKATANKVRKVTATMIHIGNEHFAYMVGWVAKCIGEGLGLKVVKEE